MKKSLLLIIINLFAALVMVHVYGQYNYLDTGFAKFLNAQYPSCLVYHVPDTSKQDPGGYTIDSTCSIIQHVDSLNISSLGIQSLEGIQYFTSLKYLNCSNNNIYESPALPSTLAYLDISTNSNESYDGPAGYLPPLPDSLIYLDFSNYPVNSPSASVFFMLPALPPSLQILKCANIGTVPPKLPNTLIYFDCSSEVDWLSQLSPRILQSLPALPPSLTYLNCSNNRLASLPELPASLIHLDCSGMAYQPTDISNFLPTLFCLPRLPQSLKFLAIPSSVSCLPNSINGLQIREDSFFLDGMGFYYDTGHFVMSMPVCASNCSNSNSIFCPGYNYATFIAGNYGYGYQWQMSTDSIHFFNITDGLQSDSIVGTNTYMLQLNGFGSSHYGYQYRCVVEDDIGTVYTLKFIDSWTGAVDSAWGNPANWSCGALPDANTDVYINSGSVVVLSSNETVRSLTVSPNASFTIAPGYNLTINH
jgi:hypothetical protein